MPIKHQKVAASSRHIEFLNIEVLYLGTANLPGMPKTASCEMRVLNRRV